MSKISWLHLSDFHIKVESAYDQSIIQEAFFRDLVIQLAENDTKLSFIFFTGDVAFSASQKEYELAIQFFNKLCNITDVDKRDLFIIPGNHDVNRYNVSKLLDDSRMELRTREDIREILSNDHIFQRYLMRFDNYSKFISELYGTDFEMGPSNYFLAEIRTIDEIRFGIIGLNTVWASYGGRHDSNNIYVSEVQLDKALTKVQNTSIRIVLLHHPLSWLFEEDQADIENLLLTHSHIILHGHLHRPDFQIINSIRRQQIVIPAGAIYTGRRISNSYNITSLDFLTKQIRIAPRKYYDGPRKFLKDIEMLGDDKAIYFESDIPREILSSIEK